MSASQDVLDLLRLTLTPGLGPILIARLLERFHSPDTILRASARDLEHVRGIGAGKSVEIVRGLKESARLAESELALAQQLGIALITRDDPQYPPLLAPLPAAPPLLYMKGRLDPADLDAYPVAIVGSRRATAYGIEQAERFAGVLARSGLTIVSGGARGIDTAAHRGALRSAGRTVAILGCGLARCYPPENQPIFDKIAEAHERRGGAILSELPLNTPPEADNFPARNRLISGMCLGVIVIEAGSRSGSLITARIAADDHGREVMAVPGRVDSPASAGTHELLKEGAAALITDPADVLHILESPARHAHGGTHIHRYTPADPDSGLFESGAATALAESPTAETRTAERNAPALPLSQNQQSILAALGEPRSIDDLLKATGLSPAALRSEVTILEIQKRIVRKGGALARP